MEIRYYKKNEEIKTYADWERVFKAAKPKDWKEGRSAQSLADFMMRKNGFESVRQYVGEAIQTPAGEIVIEKATVEGRIAFDDYNHSREYDLAIEARTKSGKTIFIGVEAKVDESFGSNTIEQYRNSSTQKNPNSTVPSRIDGLKSYFPKNKENEFEKLQYQLATATAGTLRAQTASKTDFDVYVFMVLVFTDNSDAKKREKNKKAFALFLNAIAAQELCKDTYQCESRGKTLIIIDKDIKTEGKGA